MTHGGKRTGAGRKKSDRETVGNLNVRITAEEQAIFNLYPNKTRAVELLASGLLLGGGSVGDLSATETTILREAINGTYIDALTLRMFADEVAEVEHPEAAALAERMRTWGDWELLHALLILQG